MADVYEDMNEEMSEEAIDAQPAEEPVVEEEPAVQEAPVVQEMPVTEEAEEAEELPAAESVAEEIPAVEEPMVVTDPYTPPKKEKQAGKVVAVIAVALIFSILGSLLGAGAMYWFMGQENQSVDNTSQTGNTQPTEPQATTPQDSTGNTSGGSSTILEGDRVTSTIDITKIDTSKLLTQAEVYALNVKSTVGITTSITTTNSWGQPTTAAASGSGFVFSNDGYILTNSHVIEDSDSITVSMYDGTTYAAKLIGYDDNNDVAVLKIEAQGLTPVVLGNSDAVNVGDAVVAIGNPLGELTFSLTAGYISAKDREITMSSGSTMKLMQTDCAINSGNSGGALFNLYGEVIGITNAKYSGSSSSGASIDNIGFAIPINKARAIATAIIEKGYFSKPYIGISVTTVSKESQNYGLPQGAAIQSITAGSPAEAAGLKKNDIITHINGVQITSHTQISAFVAEGSIGDVLTLTVYRQGKTIEITLTVGEQIQSASGK